MNIEEKVISAVLKDKQIHVLLQANVDNLLRTHSDIWQFIKEYNDQNKTVPPSHLVEEKFSGFIYNDEVGTTKHHLDELRSDFLDDRIRTMLRGASTAVQDGKTGDALDILINETSNIKRLTSTVRDIDVTDVDDTLAHFEEIKIQNENGVSGITTGLKGFDSFLPSGVMPGQFGVLLAYPAIGKSWFAQYMAVQAWRQGRSPLIISLEMTEAEVRNRILTIIGNGLWSHRKLSAGLVETDMLKKWMDKDIAGKPPIRIISNDGLGEVTPAVVKGKMDQYKPDIVFIDYLNLMSSNTRTESEVVKMKNLSRELKLLAISDQIPIVAISSATPDDATDMNSVPTLGQTSWSKQIAYDADWLVALGRARNSDVLECVWRKNRNGMLGDFMVQADFDSGRFLYKDID